jgi:hypothetical protein
VPQNVPKFIIRDAPHLRFLRHVAPNAWPNCRKNVSLQIVLFNTGSKGNGGAPNYMRVQCAFFRFISVRYDRLHHGIGPHHPTKTNPQYQSDIGRRD